MSDLAERLRRGVVLEFDPTGLVEATAAEKCMAKAADEIERLTAVLSQCVSADAARQEAVWQDEKIVQQKAEIERLKAALRVIRDSKPTVLGGLSGVANKENRKLASESLNRLESEIQRYGDGWDGCIAELMKRDEDHAKKEAEIERLTAQVELADELNSQIEGRVKEQAAEVELGAWAHKAACGEIERLRADNKALQLRHGERELEIERLTAENKKLQDEIDWTVGDRGAN